LQPSTSIMSGRRRVGGSDVAKYGWGGGVPERIGNRKRRSDDSESDDVGEISNNGSNKGYYTASGLAGKNSRTFMHNSESSAGVGIIERVVLENFMCHNTLTWEPNHRVNFVTGQNGSGKSSVLQGLVLGLLGESKHIKRFSKVSEFIKKDASRAVIQVTLRNTGEDSYKEELYGKSVTFQRTINESGTSAYLLKDENMRDVVRKSKEAKDECKRILDKFQIQVDSPIVILQQDEAKEMLKIESPDKLYRFFEKATLIKQCFDQYSAAQVEYNKAYDTLKDKARALKDLNIEYRRAQAKYDEIQRSEQMDKELMQTKGQYAWARVHAARENNEGIGVSIEKVTKKIEQPKAKLMSLHEKLAEFKMQKTELEVSIEDETSKFSTQEQELLGLKEEVDRLKQDMKQLSLNLKEETQRKNSISQEMRVLREQLEELTKKDGDARGDQQKREHQRKIMLLKLEKDKKDVEEQILQEGQTRELVDSKIKEDIEKEQMIRQELTSKGERKILLQRELEELEGAQGSEQHLAVFGAKIPQIELAIKRNASRFQQVPIGPVGAHVKLRGEAASNPDLARLVETELSRAQITSYLCNSDEDRRQLSRLLDDVYGTDRHKPRIFTSKFIHRPHNVTRPAVSHKDTSLLMDLLHIENPVVFNHLVDQKSIESVLVCRSQDTAKALMTRRENVPANVHYAVTHDFYRFYPPREYTSYRSYYMEALQGSGMLRSTMSNLVAERSQEMRGLEQHLKELQQEMVEVGRSKKSYEAEKKRAMSEIQKLRSKVANINSQVSQVKAEEDNAEDNAEHLSTKLVSRQADLTEAEEKIQETLNEREMLTDLLNEKEDLFKRNKKELNELKSATNPLLKEQREIETQITNKTKEILNQEKLVKKLNSELDSFKSELKKNREEERQFEAAAKKITGKEIIPDKTVKQLNAKIVQLQKRIKNKHANLDLEAFIEEFGNLKERYVGMKKHIEKLENLLETIEKMNSERLDNFICIRNIITNNVRRRFNLMIKEFSKQIGSEVFLRIDNTNKELTFSFKNTTGSRSSSDVSVLSGGEKSFTQMCLICALWDMMRPPFRCLDEWDVFLDAVNRKAISEELLNFSLRNQDRQFIFISPQGACDLSKVNHGSVSITEIKKS